MPSKTPGLSEQELFRMLLTNMIDMGHPLVRLAGRWVGAAVSGLTTPDVA
jgi:hypothetical protein